MNIFENKTFESRSLYFSASGYCVESDNDSWILPLGGFLTPFFKARIDSRVKIVFEMYFFFFFVNEHFVRKINSSYSYS